MLEQKIVFFIAGYESDSTFGVVYVKIKGLFSYI